MLTTTTAFDNAIIQPTMEVHARLRWWFSWNQLTTDPAVVDAVGTSFDAELFPVDSVLNEYHQTASGSSYLITDEGYTSTDPRFGFRIAPSGADINPLYVVNNKTAGAGNTTIYSDIQITYPEAHLTNVIEVQLETLRTGSTAGQFVDPKVRVSTKNGGAWTEVYALTALAASSQGRLVLYWNGTTWSTTEQYNQTPTTITGIRLEIGDTSLAAWNPKVRYFGAYNVVDISDDIISFSVNKSEGEQLTYLPFAEPSANTASLVLDNTSQEYAFAPVGTTQPLYDINMKITFELGIDTSDSGGSGIEYLNIGTFYVDGINYNTDMDLNMTLSDRTKFLQRKFLDDCYWEGKTLRFIIRDIMSRVGFNAQKIDFELEDNAGAEYIIPYAWYRDDTLVWDAIVQLMKSRLGTVMIREDEDLFVSDAYYTVTKLNDGPIYTATADVDIERIDQDFTVDANKVKVKWIEVGKNIDERGIVVPTNITTSTGNELGYSTSGPIEVSQVLWEPGTTLVLNAATLYDTLTAVGTVMRLQRPDGDTFPEEGVVNIEGEYIRYDGKTTTTNYIELAITERGAFGTTASQHDNAAADKATMDANDFSYYLYAASGGPIIATTTNNGSFVVEQDCNAAHDNVNTWTAYRPFGTAVNPSASDYAYGTLIKFKPVTAGNQDNMAGMFVHAKPTTWGGDKTIFDTYWIEIVSLDEIAGNGYIQGSVRVYRTSDKHTVADTTPLPPTQEGIFGFVAEIVDEDIPVAIDVYYNHTGTVDETGIFTLYINGSYITNWQAEYKADNSEIDPDIVATGFADNYHDANETGNFGVYVRGDTKAEFDYVYGGALERIENSRVTDYLQGGFTHSQGSSIYGAENFIEFGSVVHEWRRFDVDHQVGPNRWARIFHSNEREAQILYQNHTFFKSEFEVINTSRSAAVLVGNDSSVYNGNLGANHQFFVYGSTVIELESGEVVAKDDSSIRKRGTTEVEINNQWIQDEDHADELSTYIMDNWSSPVDFFTITVFPNFALQPGDIIDVEYNEKGF